MKTTGSLAAFAATAAAQQFVLYAKGDENAAQRADPIITPGSLSGHVHDFLGAGSFAPELSYESLQDTDCTTVGAADGSGNSQDNSVYWHPALYAEKKDGSGFMKVPTTSHKMYYRKPAAKKYAEPFEFPEGFRMVAGDPFLREPNKETTSITKWRCVEDENVGKDGGFPTGLGACAGYTGFMGTVHFPHCWNGEDFNQEDPSAHMAYPEGDLDFGSGDCPSSHPTALPHIFMENLFDIAGVYEEIDTSTLTLAQGDRTGYGWHADFFNGWVSGAIPELFDTCPQGEYGNHDVGLCPSYKPYSTPGSECSLKTYYKEDVLEPGANLIGCNPIVDDSVARAPILAVAKLGSATTSCSAVGGGSNSSDDSSDDTEEEAPSYSAPAAPSVSDVMSILPVPTTYAAPTTTFATATTPATTAYGTPAGGWESVDYGNVNYAATPEEDDDEDVEYVTEWVEATAVATAYAKRDNAHRHNHMRAHNKRRNF